MLVTKKALRSSRIRVDSCNFNCIFFLIVFCFCAKGDPNIQVFECMLRKMP